MWFERSLIKAGVVAAIICGGIVAIRPLAASVENIVAAFLLIGFMYWVPIALWDTEFYTS